MTQLFEGFNWAQFWEQSDYAREEYQDDRPSDSQIAAIESRLGYKLPRAFIELAQHQNGGIPVLTCHRTLTPTSWAEDHVAISGIYSIGDSKPRSLCGRFGSQFWMDEWQYPPIGIYFADCPSAGHDMLCLDYRECGSTGEPQVSHVDQESGHRITPIARNFESFIRGLEHEKNL